MPGNIGDVEHEVPFGDAEVVYEIPRQEHRRLHAMRQPIVLDEHGRARQHAQLNVLAGTLIALQRIELAGDAQIRRLHARERRAHSSTKFGIVHRQRHHVDHAVAHGREHRRGVRQFVCKQHEPARQAPGSLNAERGMIHGPANDDVRIFEHRGERPAAALGVNGI